MKKICLFLFSISCVFAYMNEDYIKSPEFYPSMESDWDSIFNTVVEKEGGYVNDPMDKGGETNYGISKRYYPNLDIKSLQLEQAKEIYYKDYYLKSCADKMPFYRLKLEVFDAAVNIGVLKSKELLQESLNLINKNQKLYKNIAVDGVMGKKTFLAIEVMSKTKKRRIILIKTFNGLKFIHYAEIIKNSEKQERFFQGWVSKRVNMDYSGYDQYSLKQSSDFKHKSEKADWFIVPLKNSGAISNVRVSHNSMM